MRLRNLRPYPLFVSPAEHAEFEAPVGDFDLADVAGVDGHHLVVLAESLLAQADNFEPADDEAAALLPAHVDEPDPGPVEAAPDGPAGDELAPEPVDVVDVDQTWEA